MLDCFFRTNNSWCSIINQELYKASVYPYVTPVNCIVLVG